MGSGIAEVAAKAGFSVVNVDTFKEGLNNSKKRIEKDMLYLISKNKITEQEAEKIKNRIRFSSSYESLANCDVVIEAVPEKIGIKQEVFNILDTVVKSDGILLSNTSALSISDIAINTKTPNRIAGMHFFHPAPVMKLVEVIRGSATDDDTEKKAVAFAKDIGKVPIVANETPGFIVNRLLVPMLNEAAYMVMEGAKPEDIDTAMKLGANHMMGPLELIDYTGVDITYGTINGLYEGLKDEKYRPCPLLIEMIAAGKLGRKSGEGFYKY
ncbi:MAG: 3-hydroxyacyl-CoA dehydrogenase NAD-binding domain-containing protein [Oscillospiraceae bacterium]